MLFRALFGWSTILFVISPIFAISQFIEPPKAKKEKHITIMHGDTLVDNYHWLRQKDNYEVINHLSQENGYTQRMMKRTEWSQEKLFEELRSRMDEDYTSYPAKKDDFYYYSRYEKDKNYAIYCRKKGSLNAQEEIILDVNQLAEGLGYISVMTTVSPDHKWLAYRIDYTGGGKTSLYFKNLNTGEIVNDEVHRVGSILWFNDSKTIAYTRLDTTNRNYIVLAHEIGTKVQKDRILYEEEDKTFSISLGKTVSKDYLLVYSQARLTAEMRFMDANDPKSPLKVFSPRVSGEDYSVEHIEGDSFFHVVKFFPSKNGSVLITPLDRTLKDHWVEKIPSREDVRIQGFSASKDYLVLTERKNGKASFNVISRTDSSSYKIDFGNGSYMVSGSIQHEYGPEFFHYNYSTMVDPGGLYSFNLDTRETKLLKATEVNNYNKEDFETHRIFATASDGTEVPITVAHKKGIILNGENPLVLDGYGAYGAPTEAYFVENYISLLERGFVVAIAHIRGGGDLGYEWYEQGKLLNKKNTFTDFITCAEKLMEAGYTNNEKIVIKGGSAGGLTMGAVVNMRPDLFKAAVLNVPFVDVINTMMDEKLPLTTFEYTEWGNPDDSIYYHYMKSYSPYDNIRAQDYPIMLVQGGYNDRQVGYWEPAKFVAKLREFKTDNNPLLLKIHMSGAHGLSSGRYNGLKNKAFEQMFILDALGMDVGYGIVSGKVTNEIGEPMPYVNVIIEGSTSGTVTNNDGEYFLELKEGQYNLLFSHVAYKVQKKSVSAGGEIQLDVTMEPEDLMLRQVVVSDNYTDPAYEIIKNAIDKRKDYLRQVNSFSSDVYMKSFDRLDEIPEKLPAFLPKEDLPDSSDLGLIYLSESVSRLHKQFPDDIKEVMISSKVGGWSQGYSWNRAGEFEINMYENLVQIGDLAARGIVSPVASNALLFYQYEYLGEVEKSGSRVSKIKVIPRRRNDPVFSGDIYIAEDTWNVVGADFILTNRQIEFYDTLYMELDYVKVNEGLWMPSLIKSFSHIKIFGFAGSTNNIISYKNYDVDPDFGPKFFNNEIFKIDKEANKKDSVYWEDNRPVKLTDEEKVYYYKKDSLEELRNSPEYLDSLDRKRNKFKVTDLISGYNYYNRHDKRYYYFDGLLESVQFNTVEGLVLSSSMRFRKTDWWEFDEKNYSLDATLRYGFANQRLNGTLSFSKQLDRSRFESIYAIAGRTVDQINSTNPISDLVNAGYSLLLRQNYMKLYGKNFGLLSYQREIINGLYFRINSQYEDREALVNNTNYAFVSENENRRYTSNDPLAPVIGESPEMAAFDPYQAWSINASLRIRFKQKYATRPFGKTIYGSKYPSVTIDYRKGIPALGSDVNYDFASVTVGDDFDFGLFGKSSFDIIAGGFLNTSEVPFIDFRHFSGNQTIFLNRQEVWGYNRSPLKTFHLLDYFTYSTTDAFLEAHYEHHFNGFLVNKIPLLRRLKWQALGGVNFLRLSSGNQHLEIFGGFENVFKVARIDLVAGYSDLEDFQTGIRIWFGIGQL